MEDITMDQEEAGRRKILKQREILCMTRSDSMSIGSIGSDLVSGGSEEMDTEDSEKDTKEGFIHSGRCRLSSQERLQKGLMLPLDNQKENNYDLERITGDVTSPVIENKLSDDVNGYYAMRTSLLSQSAVILENGGAVGKTSSGRYQDANCNIGTGNSGTRSSCEARKSSKAFHTGYSSDSESEPEGLSCSMQSMDDKHNESYSNSKQESDISCAAEVRVKIEPKSDVDKPQDIQDEEHERKDFRSSVEVKTELCPEGGGDAEHAEILRKVSVDFQDGDASDSMAEIEKSGLEAKLARVSKRRIYSRARDLAQASDSSSESDSESESEEEDEKEMIFEDLHSAKVLFNAAQPDSEKLIEREALKMACMDDLLSDCSSGDSSEDSSDDSSDSSSAESSDSDESSDSELSSADESDDEEEEEEEKRPHKGKQTSISKDGLDKRLPEVEYLEISLPPSVELIQVGHVSSIIGSLGEYGIPQNLFLPIYDSRHSISSSILQKIIESHHQKCTPSC
nr:uncharacterized protein LOC129281617 [Lytechinus pictus]